MIPDELLGKIPEMGARIPSENNLSFCRVDVLVDPSRPSPKSLLVSFHDIENRIDVIPFLIIVDPAI